MSIGNKDPCVLNCRIIHHWYNVTREWTTTLVWSTIYRVICRGIHREARHILLRDRRIQRGVCTERAALKKWVRIKIPGRRCGTLRISSNSRGAGNSIRTTKYGITGHMGGYKQLGSWKKQATASGRSTGQVDYVVYVRPICHHQKTPQFSAHDYVGRVDWYMYSQQFATVVETIPGVWKDPLARA